MKVSFLVRVYLISRRAHRLAVEHVSLQLVEVIIEVEAILAEKHCSEVVVAVGEGRVVPRFGPEPSHLNLRHGFYLCGLFVLLALSLVESILFVLSLPVFPFKFRQQRFCFFDAFVGNSLVESAVEVDVVDVVLVGFGGFGDVFVPGFEELGFDDFRLLEFSVAVFYFVEVGGIVAALDLVFLNFFVALFVDLAFYFGEFRVFLVLNHLII